MSNGGWIVMIFSVGSVTLLFAWCIWKALSTPDETEKMHGFDFKTPDAMQADQEEKERFKKSGQ